MSKLLRFNIKGSLYFITCVTHKRRKILIKHFDLFQETIQNIKTKYKFKIIAWVVLPDHFHFLIDPNENCISDIIKSIKLSFYKKYRHRTKINGQVWQKRFWDHIIRNEIDLNNHIDYIHYNPIKHQETKKLIDWRYSSFVRFHKEGYYNADWLNEMFFEAGEYGE